MTARDVLAEIEQRVELARTPLSGPNAWRVRESALDVPRLVAALRWERWGVHWAVGANQDGAQHLVRLSDGARVEIGAVMSMARHVRDIMQENEMLLVWMSDYEKRLTENGGAV